MIDLNGNLYSLIDRYITIVQYPSKTNVDRCINAKGRCQNSSVAFDDFLQRMTNVGWQGFVAQLHPYHMLD